LSDLVVVGFSQGLLFVVFFPALILIFSVLVKWLSGKIFPEMTYLVSSGMLNLNALNQSICTAISTQ